jgi:hypothetical protein
LKAGLLPKSVGAVRTHSVAVALHEHGCDDTVQSVLQALDGKRARLDRALERWTALEDKQQAYARSRSPDRQ